MSQNQLAHTQTGRWWLCAMAFFLIAAGSFFAWRMWLSYETAQITRCWVPVSCRISSSRIVSERPTPNSSPAHRVELRYEYEFNGQKHTGTRLRRLEAAPTQHLDKAREKQLNYPPGSSQTCFVNPRTPAEAVLEHASRAALYSIWFPLLFVVGGLGMLRGALKRART
jgi:hypothetical protein